MKTQKLSFDDFEALGNAVLLNIKGGNRYINYADAFRQIYYNGPTSKDGGGGGGVNGCPQCKKANDVNGTPIPDRCNGSAHSSFSSAWDAFTDMIGGALGLGNPVRTSAAAGSYIGNVGAQMQVQGYGSSSVYSDANSAYHAQQNDIWATAYGANNCN